jgi:hypothetical protein
MGAVRDEFTSRTIDILAKRAGYVCSNPECQCPTVGAAQAHDGFINVGVASHITAASPGGPRYDPSLTSEERRDQSNGVWLCQTHAKLIDSDAEHFTAERLRQWKRDVEQNSFRKLVTPEHQIAAAAAQSATTPADELESLIRSLIAAGHRDLAAFKRTTLWPRHAIPLNLRITAPASTMPFDAAGLAAAIETFNEIVVVAPPAMGKTVTLLQAVEALLGRGGLVAVFIPLGQWSAAPDTLFASILRRHAFAGASEAQLRMTAERGRLVLIIDGWNELDPASRRRARAEIDGLRRDYPALNIILSTRRQGLDWPISGPVVEIDRLSEDQQIEIARAVRGAEGEAILDHAWRTPGIRELATIPLYLTALLANAPGSALPTTREEVLRMFVREHERAADKAEILRATLFGFHSDMLEALAVVGASSANTTIPEGEAFAAVARAQERLFANRQLMSAIQPATVLDTLVNHHLLIRVGGAGNGIAFPHQQFQEWYASFEVERLMKQALAGQGDGLKRLREDVLNRYAWEESILFTCERLSRGDARDVQADGAAIVEALGIDPMLAAEMIYRSSSAVWRRVREIVMDFVRRWHAGGKVDRAVRFMITTGQPDFAPVIWPFIANGDSQVYLAALRAARRFRPSVLGTDAKVKIAGMPDEHRANVLSDIAHWSGMDGLELVTEIARADASPSVQAAVIEALRFRRADRFVAELLANASDEVWQKLGQVGDAGIADPAFAERIRREHARFIESEPSPLRRLQRLLRARDEGLTLTSQIGPLIESNAFAASEQNAASSVQEAYKAAPREVTAALLHRLEAGLEVPFRAADLIRASGVTLDAGPIVDMVLQAGGPKGVASAAASAVGPATVGKLIDQLLSMNREMNAAETPIPDSLRERYDEVRDRIANASAASLVGAILARPAQTPDEIRLLAYLIARHDAPYEQPRLQVPGPQLQDLIATLCRWSEVLVASPESSRGQLAEVASVMGRIGAPELTPRLEKMLAEDRKRWRQTREEFLAAPRPDARIRSDAQMSYSLIYGRAFAAIGGDFVIDLMKRYLGDLGYYGFGVTAAFTLRDIWKQGQDSHQKGLTPQPDFSEVQARRKIRQTRPELVASSPFADAILDVADKLMELGAIDEAQKHALQLAEVGLSMAYGDRGETIHRLLQVEQPAALKKNILTALAVAGEVIPSGLVLEGIQALLAASAANRWQLENQGCWQMENWLALLPITERPAAIFDALALLGPNPVPPYRLRGLLTALGYSPSDEADELLKTLAKQDSEFLFMHEWLSALAKRDTAAARRTLFEFICEGAYDSEPRRIDGWTLARMLAADVAKDDDLRRAVYDRCENQPGGPGSQILEAAIADAADDDGVLLLLRSQARQGKTVMGPLGTAIRHVAEGSRPSSYGAGSREMFSVGVRQLRKELFALTNNDSVEAQLAIEALNAIGEIRDDYGVAESEPRHPDISADRPWPILPS